jgi:hypothetical protein
VKATKARRATDVASLIMRSASSNTLATRFFAGKRKNSRD